MCRRSEGFKVAFYLLEKQTQTRQQQLASGNLEKMLALQKFFSNLHVRALLCVSALT